MALATVALTLTATVPASAAAIPLKAPAPRYFASGLHVSVKVAPIPGAVKYQVIAYPSTLVATLGPSGVGGFLLKSPRNLTVRAVDRNGRTGYNSVWMQPSALPGWSETSYYLTGSNITAYGLASVNFLRNKAPACLRDQATKKAYDELVKKSAQSRNLYGVSASVLASYYADLFTAFSTSSCTEIKKMAPYVAQMVASALVAPSSQPVALMVQTVWTKPAWWLPHYCYVDFGGFGGGDIIRHPATIRFNKFISQTSCTYQASAWY